MQAIVLAAGEGRRLRPLTAHRPKVMIPVGGQPILEHVVEALVANDVTKITLVTGYHREKVQTHFQDGDAWDAKIDYVHQPQQLGAGHALRVALDTLHPTEPFITLPGDKYVSPALVKTLIDTPGDAALVTTHSRQASKYEAVSLEGGHIQRIARAADAPKGLISTAVYRLPPDIHRYVEDPKGVVLTDAVNQAVADGLKLRQAPTEDAWQDVIFPWDVLTANHHVLRHAPTSDHHGTVHDSASLDGPVAIGDGSTVRAGCHFIGPVHVGSDCDIGPYVVIRGPATIGDNVQIGPFGDLENVAIMDNVQVDTNAVIRHAVLDDGARLGPRVSIDRGPALFETDDGLVRTDRLGAVVGQDAFLGANVVLEPGAIIGNGATVAANRTVRRVPDGGEVV